MIGQDEDIAKDVKSFQFIPGTKAGNVRFGPSLLGPTTGLGAFVIKKVRSWSPICPYDGELKIATKSNLWSRDQYTYYDPSREMLLVGSRGSYGCLIQDPLNDVKCNCRIVFLKEFNAYWVCSMETDIPAGSELYLAYGHEFWMVHAANDEILYLKAKQNYSDMMDFSELDNHVIKFEPTWIELAQQSSDSGSVFSTARAELSNLDSPKSSPESSLPGNLDPLFPKDQISESDDGEIIFHEINHRQCFSPSPVPFSEGAAFEIRQSAMRKRRYDSDEIGEGNFLRQSKTSPSPVTVPLEVRPVKFIPFGHSAKESRIKRMVHLRWHDDDFWDEVLTFLTSELDFPTSSKSWKRCTGIGHTKLWRTTLRAIL